MQLHIILVYIEFKNAVSAYFTSKHIALRLCRAELTGCYVIDIPQYIIRQYVEREHLHF